jgi:hypothetical protein
MWIFVAEALGALSLLLLIVWWTLGPTHRREQEELQRLVDDEAKRSATGDKAKGATEER